MGRAYLESQRVAVKELLEQGHDEQFVERETGVSDRTIRRWKLELTKTGRIGKVCVAIAGSKDIGEDTFADDVCSRRKVGLDDIAC